MVQHNVPFAVADHFSPLLKECFKDSTTAQDFKCAGTKTTCIINGAVTPYFRNELVMKMRENPFTLITDGSNDTGIMLTATVNSTFVCFKYILEPIPRTHTYTHLISYRCVTLIM